MLEPHLQGWYGSWGNWAYPLETLPCTSGSVGSWVAVPPLALADNQFVHTAGTGDYIAAAHTAVVDRAAAGMVDTVAVHIAVNMAATADIVPFVHRPFVGQERLLS